ncbi:MAG: DUF4202 domain-containing protein [Myxococcota bacterium]|nr:DUF4202 domain-containing protein [Myxococcota bacterium]
MGRNTDERFLRAIARIDAANGEDPERIEVRGKLRPKELVHAELVTQWLKVLCREPSEALLLAGRAHHVRRWESPRSSYPAGRTGYLRWRAELQRFHARTAAELITAEGYDSETVERVQRLITKRGLGSDPEVQALEDALCLVFFETQLEDFARRSPEKAPDVLARTAKKMSAAGRRAAAGLELGERARDLLAAALASADAA